MTTTASSIDTIHCVLVTRRNRLRDEAARVREELYPGRFVLLGRDALPTALDAEHFDLLGHAIHLGDQVVGIGLHAGEAGLHHSGHLSSLRIWMCYLLVSLSSAAGMSVSSLNGSMSVPLKRL